jgi:membrane protease YdiL (CAAX protease family)
MGEPLVAIWFEESVQSCTGFALMSTETPSTTLRRPTTPDIRLVHGLILLILMAVPAIHPALNRWPFAQAIPALGYAGLLMFLPGFRKSAQWLRVGKLNSHAIIASAVVSVISATALVTWALASHPDFHRFAERIPVGGLLSTILGGLVFAVLNATMEEVAWRGVILDALEARAGMVVAVLLQGIAFGIGHWSGIPGGPVGVILASLYGITFGVLRKYEDGLLLCIAAHICADTTIYCLVASSR